MKQIKNTCKPKDINLMHLKLVFAWMKPKSNKN